MSNPIYRIPRILKLQNALISIKQLRNIIANQDYNKQIYKYICSFDSNT